MSLKDTVFKTILNPDERDRIEQLRKNHERQVAEFAAFTPEELAEIAEYFLKNCERPRQEPGSPVYDVVMHNIIIPELIKRVKELGKDGGDWSQLHEEWAKE